MFSSHEELMEISRQHREQYQAAMPFPHIQFNDFFDASVLKGVVDEFPDLEAMQAKQFEDERQKKFAGNGEQYFGPKTIQFCRYLNSQPFLEFLQELTGIERPLIGDPYFVGGGQHEIKRGGFLKVHADFNFHPQLKLDRRLNVLVYLNEDWEEAYGGFFELWEKDMSKCGTKIAPKFNTMAVFSTTSDSFHGHPDPLECPDTRSRKSLAFYYYTNGRPDHEISEGSHNTIFRARPESSDSKSLVEKSSLLRRVVEQGCPPVLLRGMKNLIRRGR